MSQGLIPVTFPIGVAPEIIKNGKNGYIVNSVKEMTEKVEYLLNRKKSCIRMAEAAIEAVQQFQSKIIVKQYADLYAEIKTKRENDFYRSLFV